MQGGFQATARRATTPSSPWRWPWRWPPGCSA